MAQAGRLTIFSRVSKEDPKHGRWILPLVVLALVAFTYTFVNNLPAAETKATTTVAADPTTSTTAEEPEETTTTTLPEDVIAFVSTTDALAARAVEMRARADTINAEYPDITGYGATKELMSELKADTTAFAEDVANVVVPATAMDKWIDVNTAAAAMEKAADDMLDGLVNTSGSEKRLGALEDYNVAAATFDQAVDAAQDAATDL